jgi:uncharacterized protein with ATP-grasp and redox domains
MTSDYSNKGRIHEASGALIIQNDTDAGARAWLTTFFIENHLDYFTFPDHASTPEQIRFMVFCDEDCRYYPCSNQTFDAIMARRPSDYLRKKYTLVLKTIINLIHSQIDDKMEKEYLTSLIRIKYNHETRDDIMIPTRVQKRLLGIFLKRTQIEDPFRREKSLRNKNAAAVLNSKAFNEALDYIQWSDLALAPAPASLPAIKHQIEKLELSRRLTLLGHRILWESDASKKYSKKEYLDIFKKPLAGNGINRLFDFMGVSGTPHETEDSRNRNILWLADESGEIIFDLKIIRYLASLGHKIIIAFKEGPLFTKADFFDAQEDPVLNAELADALLISDNNIGKNELARTLRSEHHILALSDGTSEELNLILTSTTFSRIFKEVDAVIARGAIQKRRLFETRFQFTQDIFNISTENDGTVTVSFKPRHPEVIKFSHADLDKKANAIINRMEDAKNKGMTVMFYSGIIGSIPGKLVIAKKVMSVFVSFLKEQSALTFIINPSEHFEPGMDADDLMYMWEIVQSSGLINIWRFQSYQDITRAFEILGMKIPPEWVGKDATYSTGCTQEMRIALSVQQRYPEMQIIGPDKEKFMRRSEYGVGKLYDRRLGDISQMP